jgi:hypothetical protein
LRTNDPLLIARVTALLEEAGIDLFVADASISAMTGLIGAFPQRLFVPAHAIDQARKAMIDIGLAHELPDVC